MGHVLCHFWSTNALLFCGGKEKRWQSGWCSLGIHMWSQSCTTVVCSWSARINIFKCMSSQGSFCLRGPRSPMYAALVLSQSTQVYQLKCDCASTVCFTRHRRCQMVILLNASSATLLLPCSYRVMSIDINWLSRGLSAPPKSTFDVRNGGVPQLLQSFISKELLNNSWLCQMSWYIFPVIAQKLSFSSQEKLWTLHYNFQKSLLVLGSLNSNADGDDRRTEEVRAGHHALCFCTWESGYFQLNAHSSEEPQISTCIWKTFPHLCFFHMLALDGYENHRFQLGYPRNFLV